MVFPELCHFLGSFPFQMDPLKDMGAVQKRTPPNKLLQMTTIKFPCVFITAWVYFTNYTIIHLHANVKAMWLLYSKILNVLYTCI